MADVDVKFGGTLDALRAAAEQSNALLEGFKDRADSVTESIRGVGEIIGISFTVEGIKSFIESFAELGEQTERMANIFGTTTQEVGLLNFAAQETGGSGEALMRSLERLSLSLQQAESSSTPTAAAIRALGLDARTLSEMPLPQMLDTLRDKFSQLPQGIERTAIAQALVRNGAESLLPVLQMSNEKWQEVRASFEATGAAMSGETAQGFAETSDRITTFRYAIEGLGDRMFTVLKPAIDAALDWLTSFTEHIDGPTIRSATLNFTNLVAQVITSIGDLAITVAGQLGLLEGKMDGIARRAALIGGGATGGAVVGSFAGGVGAIPGAAIGGLVGDVAANTWDDIDQFNGKAQAGVDQTKAIQTQFDQTIAKFKKSITDALAVDPIAVVGDRAAQLRDKLGEGNGPRLNIGGAGSGSDAADAARVKVDGEISALQAGLSRKQALLNSELQMHRISDQQYVQQSEEAVNEEYGQEVALLQKELQLNGLKLTQRQELLNKLKALEEKHAADIQKIQQKSAQDQAKSWQSIGDSIASAMNSQVSGLLKGTESLGQAIENIGLSLASTVIENAIKSLMASAATTFGGIFAFLSPTMGPAAAAPAAAGQAAVMAAAGGIASLDVGTWSVPRDMMANIHAGETVMPAFESGQFRAMVDAFGKGQGGTSTPGDTHNHFHGAILDGRKLLRQIAEAKRLNPSLAT